MAAPLAPRSSRWWTPLGLALLCAHCSLSILAAGLAAAGLLSAPVFFGIDWNWVWPPVAIVGAFGLWLWSGREKQAACHVPRADD